MKVQDVEQKQERKVKTDITKEVESLNNYVLKCFKVARMLLNITHNGICINFRLGLSVMPCQPTKMI